MYVAGFRGSSTLVRFVFVYLLNSVFMSLSKYLYVNFVCSKVSLSVIMTLSVCVGQVSILEGLTLSIQ